LLEVCLNRFSAALLPNTQLLKRFFFSAPRARLHPAFFGMLLLAFAFAPNNFLNSDPLLQAQLSFPT
jgi:hypothetical protein